MNGIQNNTGIAGIWHGAHAASDVYSMLHSLQHRGSDGAGIAAANGTSIKAHKGQGTLSEVFKPEELSELEGFQAIGQVRMACPDDLVQENLQPVMVRAHQGAFALVSTGMISNGESLRKTMQEEGLIFQGMGDAEIIAHLIQLSKGTMQEKITRAVQMLKGPYTFLLMTKNTMYAARSPQGVGTLWAADTADGIAFATETSGFAMLDVENIRQVEAGQLVILGKNRFETRQMDAGRERPCAMESVYYGREDSLYQNTSIHRLRAQAGEKLAAGETEHADIVIGVPDTALSAASAFARTLKIPYELGMIKNRYIGSTFVTPSREQREKGIRVRLNAISSIVKGKDVFLIDDSVQKGLTARRICQLLREAGARKVHLRIASPRIQYPCLYGVEYHEQKDLCAGHYTDSEMEELFNADSIRFLDPDDFESILPCASCMACMDGEYPYALCDYESLVVKKGNE